MHLIAVVGGKRSGKTTAVETLVRGLVKHGFKVATVKHVSQKNFTIDTQGKDTWRHARAGAYITTTVSSNEMAITRKGDTSRYRINDIIKTFKNEVDIIIFEGFRKLVGQEEGIPKVVAVKTVEEALEMSKQFKPIIAFVGPYNTKDLNLSAPHINVLTDPEKLVRLVLGTLKS